MSRAGWYLTMAVLVVGAGCATSGGSGSGPGSGPYAFSQRDFPASGKCRVWDIGKKAAEQVSKDMACEDAIAGAPKPGWVVRRSDNLVFLNRISDQGKTLESHRYDGFTAEYIGPAVVPK